MKKITVICILLAFSLISYSQPSTVFTYEQALINDNVRSLEEDNNGNVWIGTIGGITKFDGVSFTSYTTADGLGSNIVFDILAHSSGDIYAATSGGLSVFDGSAWTNYNVGDGLPSSNIWCVEEDANQNIWIGTADMGVAFYNGTNWFSYSTANGLISNGIKAILVDRSGNVWFGAGNGVSMYDGSVFKNFNTSNGLPGSIANEIIQLYNGNIAVATSGGIAIYNYNSWSSITTVNGLPASNILSIKQDKEQNLWIGTSVGLSKYDWTTFTTYNYNDGLTNTIVTKHIITSNGDNKIWIASPFNGVTVFDNNETFIIYRTNKNLVNNEITTVYTDSDNTTWIGTKNGLNRVDGQHWRTYTTVEGLSSNEITAIHKDNNNNVWVGTIAGLNRINGANITEYGLAEGLSDMHINSISSDNSDNVYIATNYMLTVIVGETVSSIYGVDEGLADNKVNEVHYDDNYLWLLYDENIQIYDGSTFTDITATGCAENQTSSKAKCLNVSGKQFFGTDHSLRYFENGTTISNCYPHPNAGTHDITSIVELDAGVYCSFSNGEVSIYDGVWTAFPASNDVSFIASSFANNYIWLGYVDAGIELVCTNCTEAITANLSPPNCHGNNDGIVNITAPLGVYEYSVDNGKNWQASPLFNSEIGGYKQILVKDASDKIIAQSLQYLEYYDLINDAAITIEQISCFGDDNGNITLSYSNTGSHIWENGNTVMLVRENLIAGTYFVTINDDLSCTRVLTNEIIEPTVLSSDINFENILCWGDADGSISLVTSGGTIPYSYLWSNSQTTPSISNLVPSSYTCTITDANNCTFLASHTITQPQELEISYDITNNDCSGYFNGAIEVTVTGGVVEYTLEWSDDTYLNAEDNIENAAAGLYSLTVTDGNNCQLNIDLTITEPDGIEILSEDILQVHCFGESTGEIELEITGGAGILNFSWIKEGVAGIYSEEQNLTELSHGTYHLTITDENFCETYSSYLISESPELTISLDITPITCAGQTDGEILAIPDGGTGIYSAYYWHNEDDEIIGVSPHITNLGAGDYYIVVRDSYYCYDTAYATLTQAVPHVYSIESTSLSCNGLHDGTVTVTINGGSGTGFNFAWQNAVAGNTNTATGLGPGSYSVTITDPTNCIEILHASITQPYMEDIGAFEEIAYICYGDDLTLNPGSFVSYAWNTSSTEPTITVENAGVYFVEVVDATGCHLTDTITVVVSTVYQNEDINLVSVTDDGNIKLYWEKTPNQGTENYKIYKDSGSGFEYYASQNFSENAIFEDTNVDTDAQYYTYRITSVDSCGSESSQSDIHRSSLLNVTSDNNGVCYLNWSEYEGFFVVYYFIMSGTSPDNLVVVDSVLFNQFNYVQMNPNPEGTYYRIKVRRIDGCYPGDGEYYNSAYSNIAFCDNPTGIVNKAFVNNGIYPNPFSDEINFEFHLNFDGNVVYSLTNMLGQEIIEQEVFYGTSGNNRISLKPEIEPGIYILNIEFAGEVYNYKLIKQDY